jgi:hypothetical protein
MDEKRGKKQSELHLSFFESLGILLLERVEQCRVRIWHVFTREKNLLAEILVHSKTKPCQASNWNKGRRRRGGGLVLPISYGKAN